MLVNSSRSLAQETLSYPLKVKVNDLTDAIGYCILTDPIALSPCGHIYGAGNIDTWLSKNGGCPLCRKPPEGRTEVGFLKEQLQQARAANPELDSAADESICTVSVPAAQLFCSLTEQVYSDPIGISPCGHMFEREALAEGNHCPLCQKPREGITELPLFRHQLEALVKDNAELQQKRYVSLRSLIEAMENNKVDAAYSITYEFLRSGRLNQVFPHGPYQGLKPLYFLIQDPTGRAMLAHRADLRALINEEWLNTPIPHGPYEGIKPSFWLCKTLDGLKLLQGCPDLLSKIRETDDHFESKTEDLLTSLRQQQRVIKAAHICWIGHHPETLNRNHELLHLLDSNISRSAALSSDFLISLSVTARGCKVLKTNRSYLTGISDETLNAIYHDGELQGVSALFNLSKTKEGQEVLLACDLLKHLIDSEALNSVVAQGPCQGQSALFHLAQRPECRPLIEPRSYLENASAWFTREALLSEVKEGGQQSETALLHLARVSPDLALSCDDIVLAHGINHVTEQGTSPLFYLLRHPEIGRRFLSQAKYCDMINATALNTIINRHSNISPLSFILVLSPDLQVFLDAPLLLTKIHKRTLNTLVPGARPNTFTTPYGYFLSKSHGRALVAALRLLGVLGEEEYVFKQPPLDFLCLTPEGRELLKNATPILRPIIENTLIPTCERLLQEILSTISPDTQCAGYLYYDIHQEASQVLTKLRQAPHDTYQERLNLLQALAAFNAFIQEPWSIHINSLKEAAHLCADPNYPLLVLGALTALAGLAVCIFLVGPAAPIDILSNLFFIAAATGLMLSGYSLFDSAKQGEFSSSLNYMATTMNSIAGAGNALSPFMSPERVNAIVRDEEQRNLGNNI